MKNIKKVGYYSILAILIITSITSILEIIYITGEDCLGVKLLPESIWDFLDGYFYYEALPLRFLIVFAIILVLSILLFIFYRKDISKTTAILSSIMPIICAIGWTCHYWISELTEKAVVAYVLIGVICIIYTVATVVLLIKDNPA